MKDFYIDIISEIFSINKNLLLNENIINIKEKSFRQPVKIFNDIYIETNFSNNMKFKIIKNLLRKLEIEDELFIKFREE